MQDDEFYDLLYQLWTKTTWASDGYWKYDEDSYEIVAVREADEFPVGEMYQNLHDAEFITAVHGCIGDLIRKLRDLEDENARLDEKVDIAEGDKLVLVQEIQQLEEELGRINDRLDYANG